MIDLDLFRRNLDSGEFRRAEGHALCDEIEGLHSLIGRLITDEVKWAGEVCAKSRARDGSDICVHHDTYGWPCALGEALDVLAPTIPDGPVHAA